MSPSVPPSEPTPSRYGRRGVLALFLAAGAGYALKDFDKIKSVASRIPWDDLIGPVRVMAAPQLLANADSYREFLTSLKLRHITVSQIISAHAKVRDGVANHLPAQELWLKLVPTLRVADLIVERLQKPLQQIVSAYRSPEYNAKCPGAASQSQHMRNTALDLVFGASPEVVADAAAAIRKQGAFRGGIGRYPGFTHIDTRGFNSDW